MKTSTLVLGMAFGLTLAACPSTPRTPDDEAGAAKDDDAVLVSGGGPFEIHVRAGRALQLIPSPVGEPPIIKPIGTLDELRMLYETSRGEPMPQPRPGGGVTLNGWDGLECVRAGHACGPAPQSVPRALVVVRFD